MFDTFGGNSVKSKRGVQRIQNFLKRVGSEQILKSKGEGYHRELDSYMKQRISLLTLKHKDEEALSISHKIKEPTKLASKSDTVSKIKIVLPYL